MGKYFFVSVYAALSFWAVATGEEFTVELYAYQESPKESVYDVECMPCTPCKNDAGTIAFTRLWKIIYVPNQSYLGRTVLIPQRHFGSYEEMSDDEAREYRFILLKLLPALTKTFGVTHFNVAYLMNMAYNVQKPDPMYKNGAPHPHFHWHIIPRYDGVRRFAGHEFSDPDFGNAFNLRRKQVLEGQFRLQAIHAIQENLGIIRILEQE